MFCSLVGRGSSENQQRSCEFLNILRQIRLTVLSCSRSYELEFHSYQVSRENLRWISEIGINQRSFHFVASEIALSITNFVAPRQIAIAHFVDTIKEI